jgi:8-oxo-dGTP diphosphatase
MRLEAGLIDVIEPLKVRRTVISDPQFSFRQFFDYTSCRRDFACERRSMKHQSDQHHPQGIFDSGWARFCPRCAGTLEERYVEIEHQVRKVCVACGFIFYMNPKVVAGAIPQQGGRIWLLRRNVQPGLGLWTFPAGYVDLGERVPDAAIRETREETLLDIRLDRLLNIYSYNDAAVVLVVYAATVIGGRAQTTPESQEVKDFEVEKIPWGDLAFPSTAEALTEYSRGETPPVGQAFQPTAGTHPIR